MCVCFKGDEELKRLVKNEEKEEENNKDKGDEEEEEEIRDKIKELQTVSVPPEVGRQGSAKHRHSQTYGGRKRVASDETGGHTGGVATHKNKNKNHSLSTNVRMADIILAKDDSRAGNTRNSLHAQNVTHFRDFKKRYDDGNEIEYTEIEVLSLFFFAFFFVGARVCARVCVCQTKVGCDISVVKTFWFVRDVFVWLYMNTAKQEKKNITQYGVSTQLLP